MEEGVAFGEVGLERQLGRGDATRNTGDSGLLGLGGLVVLVGDLDESGDELLEVGDDIGLHIFAEDVYGEHGLLDDLDVRGGDEGADDGREDLGVELDDLARDVLGEVGDGLDAGALDLRVLAGESSWDEGVHDRVRDVLGDLVAESLGDLGEDEEGGVLLVGLIRVEEERDGLEEDLEEFLLVEAEAELGDDPESDVLEIFVELVFEVFLPRLGLLQEGLRDEEADNLDDLGEELLVFVEDGLVRAGDGNDHV